MPKVYITRKIPDAGINKLKSASYAVIISEKDGVLNKEELITAIRGN